MHNLIGVKSGWKKMECEEKQKNVKKNNKKLTIHLSLHYYITYNVTFLVVLDVCFKGI